MADTDPARTAGSSELVGRTRELGLLEDFVDRALDEGGALLLSGAPGVGKTVLLDAACRIADASGARVLRAAGVPFEADVSFAGLHQLLLPLLDRLTDLPEPQAAALSAALGLGDEPGAGHLMTVSAATLALLRRAGHEEPLLVAVDDAQSLDRSSALVVGFIARRLHDSSIGLLATIRTEADCSLLEAGLPEYEVPPLSEEEAALLLDAGCPRLVPSVRRWVMAVAQGNPLALLELPVSMTEEQRRAVLPLPPVLPLSHHSQRLFAHRVQRLPSGTRRLLLLTALDGTGDLQTLRAGSSQDGWLDALVPAERERLVRVDTATNRVTFCHPLIAGSVVGLATSSERRRAHALLADLFADPERRAWHLAEAVIGPDEPAAALLEIAAGRALHRGDAVRPVHALLRAADLSPRGADRARRLAAAAYVGADAAGRLSSVPELLGAARRADPDTDGSLVITVAAAHHLLTGEGDVDTAHLMLVRAIEDALARGADGHVVEEALHCLMLVCHFSGRDEPWRPFEAALTQVEDGVSALLSLSARLYGNPLQASSSTLDQLEGLLATANEEMDPTVIVRVALAAFYVDRLAACRSSLWRVVRDGRDGGAAASAVNALMMLAHDAYREGRWDDAARLAENGIAWSERLGYRLIALPGLYCQALLAATRGNEGATRSLTNELVAWGAPRGAAMLDHFAARALALAALGRGDYEEAYRLCTTISPPGRLVPHVPVAMWVAKDFVEAAVRTGRSEEARAHVEAMQRAEIFRLRPRLALLAAGAAALAYPDGDADEHYRQALAVPGAEGFPFELARVRLARGEHLRRTRSTAAARLELTTALETFQRLGARPWVERTVSELRASGQAHRLPSPPGAAALTAQENEIAALAAAGLSNKQIGSRLHLSPRTVSGHLYRIFPKLRVSTRAALRDALSGAPPEV
jgi:DNA-binding CsgD family transcriptional regulator